MMRMHGFWTFGWMFCWPASPPPGWTSPAIPSGCLMQFAWTSPECGPCKCHCDNHKTPSLPSTAQWTATLWPWKQNTNTVMCHLFNKTLLPHWFFPFKTPDGHIWWTTSLYFWMKAKKSPYFNEWGMFATVILITPTLIVHFKSSDAIKQSLSCQSWHLLPPDGLWAFVLKCWSACLTVAWRSATKTLMSLSADFLDNF